MVKFRNLGTDFTDGLQTPHYTNGRLLTAEDLQREQQAALERLSQLGTGFTAGVIDGFRVTMVAGRTGLQVTAGTGINRNGDVVRLNAKTIALPVQPIPVDANAPVRRSARFEGCEGDPSQPGTAPVASGAYLLTAAPLAQLAGVAPRQAPDGTETATCANQWEVEGVAFKMIRLDTYQRPTGTRSNRNRNLLAHWFYGSSKINRLMLDLFDFDPNYAGFSDIPPEDYTPCDVPLAVFFWENSRISFVDEWAVRRRLSHPYPEKPWTANLSDRRVAEGEARFLQFQEHLDDLRASGGNTVNSIRAADHFAYLPPVGFLPVNPFELIVDDVFDDTLSERQQGLIAQFDLSVSQVRERVRTTVINSLGSNTLFRLDRFFGDYLPDNYQIVHEDEIHERLQLSWVKPPITLPAPPASQSGFFDLVLLDNNMLTVTDDNFASVFANLNPSANVISHVSANRFAAADDTAPVENVMRTNTERRFVTNFEVNTARRNALLFNMVDGFVFTPDTDDSKDEPDPLVDILVIDELLLPYRQYLARQMPDHIDNAITSLTSPNDVNFVGSNMFANVNHTIYNTFLLNNFLEFAVNTGVANVGRLDRLTTNATLPPFYVVFVRHRPARRSRPLRSR